jgi:hypothetical protein
VTDVEGWWVEAFGDISGIRHVYDHLPQDLGRYPCIAMLLATFDQEDSETGPGVDTTYGWRVDLYLSLQNYKRAQDEMKTYVPQMLALVRPDPTLGQLVDFCTIRDDGEDPIFQPAASGRGEGYMAKALRVEARATER